MREYTFIMVVLYSFRLLSSYSVPVVLIKQSLNCSATFISATILKHIIFTRSVFQRIFVIKSYFLESIIFYMASFKTFAHNQSKFNLFYILLEKNLRVNTELLFCRYCSLSLLQRQKGVSLIRLFPLTFMNLFGKKELLCHRKTLS